MPSQLRRGASIVGAAVALLAASCAVESPTLDDDTDTDAHKVETQRRALLCEQGLSDRVADWDKGLFAVCEDAEAEGLELIHDGTYPAFAALEENGAYEALFDTLDDNGDGRVDDHDTTTEVSLVGFSWGGINVTDIADRLRRDSRVSSSHRAVAAIVLLDPFQPLAFHANIPSNVQRAWEYRQTKTTKGDCSLYASLGFGFNGRTPRTKSKSTECSYYDLDAIIGGIGHCDVPVAAHDAAVANIVDHEDYEPWADDAASCPVQ